MRIDRLLKRGPAFFRKNFIVSAFVLILLFVGVVAVGRFFSSENTPVYVKVKVGQGLWWAGTGRPPVWFLHAVKKGDKEYDLVGRPVAEVVAVRHYPYKTKELEDTQYEIYLTLKIEANRNKREGIYGFKRSPLIVGAPIQLDFPSAQITGAIIGVSEEPFKDGLTWASVTLTKRLAFPWEYDAIKIGDKYGDGEEAVFEITNKATANSAFLAPDPFGSFTPGTSETLRYVIVQARIKVQNRGGMLIFGEEQEIKPGSPIHIKTQNYDFDDYVVAQVKI